LQGEWDSRDKRNQAFSNYLLDQTVILGQRTQRARYRVEFDGKRADQMNPKPV
jgi:hypothetical protein